MKKLFKNTVIYSIGEVVPKILTFFLLPVFTTYLSTDDYGIISYSNSLMMFLFVLASLSLNTFVLRKYFDYSSELQKKKLIGNIFTVIIVFNIFVLISSFAVLPYITDKIKLQIPFYPYLSLSLINNFTEVFSIIPLIIYRILEKPYQFVGLNAGKSILVFFLTYFLLVYQKWGVLSYFYSKLVINILFLVPFIFVIYKHSIFNFSKKLIVEGLRFSIPLIPGAIGYLLIGISDRVLMERFISLSEIGIYSVSYTLAFSLTMFINSGYKAFEPEIFKKFGSTEFPYFVETLRKFFMFCVFSMATILSFFSKDILQLMTKGNYVEGYILIPVLLISVIMVGENTIIGSIAIAEKKPKLVTKSTLVGGIFSVCFNIIFLPIIGYYSAAIAAIISYFLMNLVIYRGISLKFFTFKKDFLAYLVYWIFNAIIIYLNKTELNFSFLLFIKTFILVFNIVMLGIIFNVNFQKIRNLVFSKSVTSSDVLV